MNKFTYTIRKDCNGNIKNYQKKISIRGKKITIYGKTPEELKIKYTKKLSEKMSGICVDDKNLTLGQWAEMWFNSKVFRTEATRDMYEEKIRLYINPNIGFIKLKNLKEIDIKNLLKKLQSNGLTRATNMTLMTLKQILNSAVQNDLIYKNVAQNIKRIHYIPKEKTALDDKYIDIFRDLSKYDYKVFMCYLMILTGLRREEVVPLKFSDIDYENHCLTINKAVHFSHNKPILKCTKNEENRKVPLIDSIYTELINRAKNCTRNDFIFVNKYGKILSATAYRRIIDHSIDAVNKEIKKRNLNIDNDIEKLSPLNITGHEFRHTFATNLSQLGLTIKETQTLTGHKDARVLEQYYLHDQKEKTIKKSEFLLNKKFDNKGV